MAVADASLKKHETRWGVESISPFLTGAVAQLGERMHGMHEVRGSIPLSSTGYRRGCSLNSARELRRERFRERETSKEVSNRECGESIGCPHTSGAASQRRVRLPQICGVAASRFVVDDFRTSRPSRSRGRDAPPAQMGEQRRACRSSTSTCRLRPFDLSSLDLSSLDLSSLELSIFD
jgi:hypothetical protein